MPHLTVADQKAHYVYRRGRAASRPPFLFIHGAGGTHQHWLYALRDLPEVAAYAVDLPGHGRSEGQGYRRVAAYADWLVAFIASAQLGAAVLVGHSLGGAIALDLALRHPTHVAGLGLVSTGARLRVAPALLDELRQNPPRAIPLLCERLYGPGAPRELVCLGARQMADTPPGVLHGDFLAADAFDVMDQLAHIAVPTVVVCGTQDRMTPPPYAAYLRDHIPGAVLHLIEGAGHMPMLESPASVSQALRTLLAPGCLGAGMNTEF